MSVRYLVGDVFDRMEVKGIEEMSETVGIVSIEDEGWVAFNLDDKVQADAFIQELRDHISGSYLPGHVTDDENPSHVRVAVHQKPDGWTAALPEFTGW